MSLHSTITRTRNSALLVIACFVLFALIVLPNHVLAATAVTAHSTTPKPTIVLVHGAWADGSSWDGVVQQLQHAGYTVAAPPNPLRGLASDAAYLTSYLHSITGPIILVGHSYGGAVITNAATGNVNVKALVYIDAFIPDQGETVFQLANAQPGSCLGGGGDPTKVFTLVPLLGTPPTDFDLYLKSAANQPYPGFTACFANDLSASKAAILQATQRPAALSAFAAPTGIPAWKTIPSWSLIGTADQVIPPAEQRFMSQRAHASIVNVHASHLSLISHPEAVTDLIMSAVAATN